MKAYSMTDTGVLREMNQDYFFMTDSAIGNLPNLYIVADGMGGHRAGDYASRHTIERVVASISRNKSDEPVTILKEAIAKANELLVNDAKTDEQKKDMGTTIVAATIIGNKMFVANVGDSRLYVINQKIRQITRDHSLVGELVRIGELDEKEARNHPKKNYITRAVGAMEEVEVDFFEVEITPDDYVLLCTDGLTNMVTDQDICKIILDNKIIEKQVETLIHTANRNGGRDNITVMIMKPFSDEVKEC